MNKAKGRGVGRKRKKKAKIGRWIFWAVLTTLNLILSFMMRVADRKNAVSAIQQDDKLSLLYRAEKTTKTL